MNIEYYFYMPKFNTMKSIWKTYILSIMLLSFAALTSLASPASSVSEDLAKGWEEYGYGIFDSSKKYFNKAAESPDATAEQFCQAMTGLAFYYQFGKTSNSSAGDFQNALEYYQKALVKIGENNKLALFVKSMMAECKFMLFKKTGDRKYLAEADSIWNEIMEKDRYSLAAQNAMLYRTAFGLADARSAETAKKLEELEKYLKPIVENPDKAGAEERLLAPAMSRMLGETYIFREDYPKAVEWLKSYLAFGPSSHVTRAQVTFKIARIYELKLGNPKAAAEFYGIFRKENPNDAKSYFATEKKAKLEEKGVDLGK